MAKIFVGLSGGVDSSVTAALLKEQGHEVTGVFMKNWSLESIQSLTDCPWEVDQADAEAVCKHLGIPFRSVNFEREYRERVVDYFLKEYGAGRTPNPDILCNSEIKFAAFKDWAFEQRAEFIATGHYARVEDGVLQRGVDTKKDQSYFLYALQEDQLRRTLFPLGAMTKPEVRLKAEALGLPTATKKDSQGICFIGHLDVKKFLEESLGSKPGVTYYLPEWQEGVSFEDRVKKALAVGKHRGSVFYTIGERAGGVVDNGVLRSYTNDQDTKPTYIVLTEPKNNRIYVTTNPHDPDLDCRYHLLDAWGWTGTHGEVVELSTLDALAKEGKLQAQARYQQEPVRVLSVEERGGHLLITTEPIRAVATGQSLVLFENDRVWGGGTICATEHTIPSVSSLV